MGAIKSLFILGLLVLNFIGAIFLLTKAGGIPYYLEIIYILVALFISLVVLMGSAFDARWTWPLATILFAVNMANAVCLYLIIGAMLSFVLLLLFNSIGILASVLLISDEDEDDDFNSEPEPVETYDVEAEEKKTRKKSKKRKR